MKYFLGPWVWRSGDDAGWYPPAGCTAGLDLRTLPQQSRTGGTPGLGVFVGPASTTLDSNYEHLGTGSMYDIKLNQRLLDAMPRRRGYAPKGPDLAGVLMDMLTEGADPDGSESARPLMPSDGRLCLCLGSVHRERFTYGTHPHTNRVRDVLRADMAKAYIDARAGRLRDREHHRRVLDFLCEQHGVEDWTEFVPTNLRSSIPGRLKHETTLTDNFNRADADALGSSSEGWSWTELTGDTDIVSNRASAPPSATVALSRADSDLSSADHYAQAKCYDNDGASQSHGVILRKDSTTTATFYTARFVLSGGSWTPSVGKFVAGAFTGLNTGSSFTFADGVVIKGQINGSALAAYRDGVSSASATDTAITGSLRTGLRMLGSDGTTNHEMDDFEAADLAGASIIYTQLERSVRGICRGMYTRF